MVHAGESSCTVVWICFLLKYFRLSPVFKFFMWGKKCASIKLMQLFGVVQEYRMSGTTHTIISALRVGGVALEEQCAQVKDYSHTPREDFSLLQQTRILGNVGREILLVWKKSFDSKDYVGSYDCCFPGCSHVACWQWHPFLCLIKCLFALYLSSLCISAFKHFCSTRSQPAPNFDKKNMFFSSPVENISVWLRVHLHMFFNT